MSKYANIREDLWGHLPERESEYYLGKTPFILKKNIPENFPAESQCGSKNTRNHISHISHGNGNAATAFWRKEINSYNKEDRATAEKRARDLVWLDGFWYQSFKRKSFVRIFKQSATRYQVLGPNEMRIVGFTSFPDAPSSTSAYEARYLVRSLRSDQNLPIIEIWSFDPQRCRKDLTEVMTSSLSRVPEQLSLKYRSFYFNKKDFDFSYSIEDAKEIRWSATELPKSYFFWKMERPVR